MKQGKGLGLQGKRVLVVEDEYFLADDVLQGLRERGAEVIGPAASLDEAFALLGQGPFDGAVLDLNLRGEMAFPLADELQARGVPFVFATGYDEAAVPKRFARVPRWEKPYDLEALADALPALFE